MGDLVRNMCFVFGSNESGIHGAGAAREARKHGAVMGFSYGHMGNTFAIPTVDQRIDKTLSLPHILAYVMGFLAYAHSHREIHFMVTRIGCGLAGLKDSEIAPMFREHSENCLFDEAWKSYLPEGTKFWGTFP